MNKEEMQAKYPNQLRTNVARKAHEVNRAYAKAIGDNTILPWDKAPQWQRDSATKGVEFLIMHPEAGPSGCHESWMRLKVAEGWVYGEKKDESKKVHPCIVPFASLPKEQQTKDHLFRAVVRLELGFQD